MRNVGAAKPDFSYRFFTYRKEDEKLRELRQDAVLLDRKGAEEFFLFLAEQKKTEGTIENYRHSLEALYEYLPGQAQDGRYITFADLKRWQSDLLKQGYAVRTVNARMSAVNKFLEYRNRRDLQVAPMSAGKKGVQPELSRAEYLRLLSTAKLTEQERTYFLLKTIATVGIRMDELKEITVEHLNEGRIVIGKGDKRRAVRIPTLLQRELQGYAERRGIRSGAPFLTKNGVPINRKHVHYCFKQLCQDARVEEEKVTPGCLRNLYYRTYETIQNSIAILTEQAYERMLEEEQVSVGWEENAGSVK